MRDNVYLCLAVWKNASDLLFIVYGQNKKIGEWLDQKVSKFLSGKGGVRSTQSISMSQLIFDYGFDVICINKTKEEVRQILSLKSLRFANIPAEQILNLNEYRHKYKHIPLNYY